MSKTHYEQLLEKAAELFPEDNKAQDEYIDGFITKVAGILGDLSYNSKAKVGRGTLGKTVAENFWGRGAASAVGKAVGLGAVGLGVAGIMGLAKIVDDRKLHQAYQIALSDAIDTQRVLKAADRAKVIKYGDTIFKFAPHVATDPNLLSSVLANAIHGDGIDPMTIRTLTELESRYQDISSTELFNPKALS